MSKTVRIKDETYDELERMLRTRETFDDIIKRLLGIYRWAETATDVLEGTVQFKQWQRKQLEKSAATERS